MTNRHGSDNLYAGTPFDLTARVAVVTGATAGLGDRLARVLHDAGATVAAVGRRQERLDELAAGAERISAYRCDLGDAAQCEELMRAVIVDHGAVDILVNNAALIHGARAQDEPPEHVREMIDVNLVAPFRLAQLAYPGMRDRGRGSIINVTSILAHVGMGRLPQAGYSATKGGLWALTRELATQWARDGVRVNAVAPGFFMSEITGPLFDAHANVHDFVIKNTPLARVGVPDDYDGAVLYLAGDASSFLTGQSIIVDGGWTAR
jgi:NAD(P)-dependent dehydrogenase (short-subunit alcohol dehydrogenase family)